MEAIIKLVANGVGVALVPQTSALQDWPHAVRALDLGPHTFHRDIGLVHRAKRNLSDPVRLLIQLIADLAQTQQPATSESSSSSRFHDAPQALFVL